MKLLYTQDEFNACKSRDMLTLECEGCGRTFAMMKKRIMDALNPDGHDNARFCSLKCSGIDYRNRKKVKCKQCGMEFEKRVSQCVKYKNHFCSHSCSAIYSNAHKTKGTRTSKMEVWIAAKLTSMYPNLEFHFNRKDAINSELDIFVPSLMIAFELNGIYHYEPIFGSKKLDSIQNNDGRKMVACHERGIGLCILDVSSVTYFKETKCQKFLDIIVRIINSEMLR
jgi:hypothetical protein